MRSLAAYAVLLALVLPATGCSSGSSLAETPKLDMSVKRELPPGSAPEMGKVKPKRSRSADPGRRAAGPA